jgi:hypothetical protein
MNKIKFNQSKLINRPNSVITRKIDETEKEVKKKNKYQK